MNANFKWMTVFSLCFTFFLTDCTKQDPIASFSVDHAIIEPGGSVNFTDQSLNDPTSWDWTFTGGTPASSTSRNPTVTYESAGQYMVSLRVSNGDGSDAVQRENCITVNLPAPVAAFTANKTSVDAGGTVTFTDQSTNQPNEWLWSFAGGTPSTSTLQNPSVQYLSGGTYTVALAVGNESGADYLQKDGYINVKQTGTSITFFNSTYTEIDIEINSIQKQIPSGGNVTYAGLTGNSVNYQANTSGETSGGTQVGYQLTWDNSITLDQSQITRNLVVPNSYYFLYLRNQGSVTFNSLEVGIMDVLNGFTADRTEYISIPNDNVDYPIGYYESYTSNEFNWIQIRAIAPEGWVYWSQDINFVLPDTTNQSIHLYNSLKKSSAVSNWKVAGDPETFLYPDYAVNPKDK